MTPPPDRNDREAIGPHADRSGGGVTGATTVFETKDLNLFYGSFQALKNVSVVIPQNRITAIIGPSGCGKSTLLRVFNRMNDTVEGVRITGTVLLHGRDIHAPGTDLLQLRKNAGMVFQRPNPFPLSVFENIAFGLRIHRLFDGNSAALAETVRKSLESVLLWEDLRDRLDRVATRLSLEQQQRLCIARLLAVKPEVLLMDEPCSALDPVAAARIEELMQELKKNYTIVIVTHNMQQAARISDQTGFFLMGELLEFDATSKIFTNPRDQRTEDYITGRFG